MTTFIHSSIRYIATCLLFCGISLSAQGLVVLQYHHVDQDSPSSTSVSPEQFLQHMALIESLGFEVVDLESASRKLLDSSAIKVPHSKQLAISFDDAYYSIFANAYPELKRRGWPFTIFVNTQAVNERNRGIMSWQQIKQLVDDGVAIANHSVSHAHLPSVPENLVLNQWLEQEVLSAQQELTRRLGKVSNMLAYPYGEFTLAMMPWLAERQMLAFGQQSGPIGEYSHPQALPRFPASGIYANIETLKTKILSLALPVSASQLREPVISSATNPPQLKIELIAADYNPSRLQCFASQQGMIKTEVKTESARNLLISQAAESLTGKRARYNCTVPSEQKNRYYWYSQPWQLY